MDTVKKFAKEYEVELFLTSALKGENVPALFENISNLAIKHVPKNDEIEEEEESVF